MPAGATTISMLSIARMALGDFEGDEFDGGWGGAGSVGRGAVVAVDGGLEGVCGDSLDADGGRVIVVGRSLDCW